MAKEVSERLLGNYALYQQHQQPNKILVLALTRSDNKACPILAFMGHTPSTAGTFRKKFRKNSGKTPEALSERFLEFPSRVRLGCPKPYNSRHLRPSRVFPESLSPSTAGESSFFGIGSGEGLSELVMEFPAVLGVFLNLRQQIGRF